MAGGEKYSREASQMTDEFSSRPPWPAVAFVSHKTQVSVDLWSDPEWLQLCSADSVLSLPLWT